MYLQGVARLRRAGRAAGAREYMHRSIHATYDFAPLVRRSGCAPEASVQYVATLAMLALLLHDRLSAREFSLLYSQFAPLIPVEELGPE